ncbi:hypothetical protein [Pedobacter aquatilis]|uniref:hypothetical protein n=1 Tax=Pedobacter aquatilis TaxID=351343 RepID=UPI00292FDBDF|nr:hypothetical protein [Pedobacter aquatilis]
MENLPAQSQKEKNSNLSIGLIMLNIILALILSSTVHEDDDPDGIMFIISLVVSATVLLGGYAFSYHGKGYRWAKIVFGILLVISIVVLGLLWYAWQLGKGFKN